MFAYLLSFIDRQILNLLVAPVRRDLGITDTQMSLLIGFSFALFYTTFSLPFGWLADSMNRPRLIAAGVFTWSLTTGGCGLVHSYWQMFLLRIGVGVGEAALSPAAYSIISDSFPPAKRAMPFGVYTTAAYLGGGFAFLSGALFPNDATTLEHIMPEKQSQDWQHISAEHHEEFVSRIGNLALLTPGFNSKLSAKGFVVKKPTYATSELLLTKMVADYGKWEEPEIEDRQKKLAKIAVKTWPI